MKSAFPADLESRLREHINELASTPRPPRSSAHRKTREYIRRHLSDAGFACGEQIVAGYGEPCVNVLTDPVPGDLPLVIIGAHYDSAPGTPGADDNASGVAALL